MSELEARIKQVVKKVLDVSDNQVTPLAQIAVDLGADSLDQIELVMAFEEEFNLEIPDEDADKLKTIGDIWEYLQKRGFKN